jgi:hypothetical protein
MLYLSLLAATVTSQPDYQLANLILMGVYVLLTLALAGVALWSVFITRAALSASSEQSQKALEASERQSKAAIEAVNKQIEASEKQSKETIDAVNKQIEANEKQAQEALYNQHKPVVVPISEKLEKMVVGADARTYAYRVGMQNKGAGVAFNAFGVVGIKDLPVILCSSKIWFLVPDNEETFTFKVQGEVMYPFNVFEEVNVFPPVGARLMITYNDAFSNKYFAVFDYSEELGWKQVYEIRRVKQRIDELLIIRHKGE